MNIRSFFLNFFSLIFLEIHLAVFHSVHLNLTDSELNLVSLKTIEELDFLIFAGVGHVKVRSKCPPIYRLVLPF